MYLAFNIGLVRLYVISHRCIASTVEWLPSEPNKFPLGLYNECQGTLWIRYSTRASEIGHYYGDT